MRYLVTSLLVIIVVLLFSLKSFFTYADVHEVSKSNITQIEVEKEEVASLKTQYRNLNEKDVPFTLKQSVSLLSEYPAGSFEIESIYAYDVNTNGDLEVVETVIDLNTQAVCDGYQVTVKIDDVHRFLEYCDSVNIPLIKVGMNSESVVLYLLGGLEYESNH